MKWAWWAVLGALALVASCRTAPVPPAVAAVPTSFPSALEAAQKELQDGHPAQAWVLVANQDDGGAEKASFLSQVTERLRQDLGAVDPQKQASRARDLKATLAFVDGSTWKPEVAAPAVGNAAGGPALWLKGTATVIVNRGLKVENGVAQPDIVIGSGFFISADGYLLTNHHVIESEVEPGESASSKLSLRLPGSKGERLPAKVVGWDRNLDLALLKAEYKPEYVFPLGGDEPAAGQRLQALGSPGGLEATVTEGIVSATKRPLLTLGEVIQIDVAVNPGNSGGPLVDRQGRAVGVVFAGIREFQGVNFAIPASLVTQALPRLYAGGRSVVPWLGLGFQEDLHGVEVVYVVPRGPADWAGIRVGDRLTSVAGTPVSSLAEAQTRLLDFGTEALVPLEVSRGGDSLRRWAALAARPEWPLKEAAMNDLTGRLLPLAFGVVVDDLAASSGTKFRVVRVWPGTSGEELQLAANDPLEVVDWTVDPKNQALITRWVVKRRLGGYLESVIQMAVPLSTRLFL